MEPIELARRAFSRDLTDAGALEDAFAVVRILGKTDMDKARAYNKTVRNVSAMEAKAQKSFHMFELNQKSLLFEAPYDFDCYLQALEMNRNPQDKFYLPRRKIMKRVVDALQNLEDDNLDELFLSMPPRVGKTTILMFYTTWLIGTLQRISLAPENSTFGDSRPVFYFL